MGAEVRVYLTPTEAESGATRMVRPAGGRWVEVSIPPTRHDAVLTLRSERGELRVRVTVVPPGMPGSVAGADAGHGDWQLSAWIGVVVLACLLGVVVVLLVVRG